MSPTAAPWMTRTVPASAFEALIRRHRLSPLAARVLAARGWQPGPALSDYLAPQALAPDPLALTGAPEAAERLWRAIDAGERITVAGDYDVDGVTGAALLLCFFRGVGATVDCYLPNRHQEGYGLQAEVLRELASAGTRVLVTVDNGTTSLEEIALATSLGIDVIVTDHHQPGPVLPAAYALLNPKTMAAPGPFEPLAGVGVAYQLTKAMEALRGPAGADAALDLVAIGTIGDRAALSGENRRLVKLGLSRLAASPRAGLAALCQIVNLELGPHTGAEAIALRLVPRLNAAGRMADARLALDLLLTDDREAGARLAEKLERLNRERQRLTRSIESSAKALLEATFDPEAPAIVLADDTWHHGVTGVVASRLVERYRKPVILFAPDRGAWRGAGRGVPGYDMHAALAAVSHHLGRYGGHPMAVGCTVAKGGLEAFSRDFASALAAQQPPAVTDANWQVDAEVPLSELTLQSVEALDCLQPTGAQNPAPTLVARNVRVVKQGLRGPEGQHLWLTIEDEGGRAEAIGFGMGALYPLGERIDCVFTPTTDRKRVQLRLVALFESPTS